MKIALVLLLLLGYMLPGSKVYDPANAGLTNPKPRGYVDDLYLAHKRANLQDFGFCENGAGVVLPSLRFVSVVGFGSSPFSNTIFQVVSPTTQKEMTRANTEGHVAFVKNTHSLGLFTKGQLPRQNMSPPVVVLPFVTSSQGSISSALGGGTLPKPAPALVYKNLRPETGNVFGAMGGMHRSVSSYLEGV